MRQENFFNDLYKFEAEQKMREELKKKMSKRASGAE
jgi:hypothetical protein